MKTVVGKVISVQEERVSLLLEDGRVLLLAAGRNSGWGVSDLEGLQKDNTRVRVAYRGDPDWQSGTAVRIQRI